MDPDLSDNDATHAQLVRDEARIRARDALLALAETDGEGLALVIGNVAAQILLGPGGAAIVADIENALKGAKL